MRRPSQGEAREAQEVAHSASTIEAEAPRLVGWCRGTGAASDAPERELG